MAKNGSLYHGKTPNSQRPAGARNKVSQADLVRRRTEAKERQATYDSLPPAEILKNLDRAFGVGQGAKKERAKLAARIAGTSQKTKPLPPPPPPGMAPLNTKKIRRETSSKDKRAGKVVAAVVATTIAAVKS